MEPKASAAILDGFIAPLAERNVKIDAVETASKEIEASRNDADDGVIAIVQPERTTQNARRSTEFALPERGADHDVRRGADGIFAGRKIAADYWVHTQDGEKGRGDQARLKTLGLARSGKVVAETTRQNHAGKGAIFFAPVLKVKKGIEPVANRLAFMQRNKLLG